MALQGPHQSAPNLKINTSVFKLDCNVCYCFTLSSVMTCFCAASGLLAIFKYIDTYIFKSIRLFFYTHHNKNRCVMNIAMGQKKKKLIIPTSFIKLILPL